MKTKIKVDYACSENWNDMLSNKNGKFCLNCQKNIIDFTQQNSQQIVDYLQQNKQVCGRINKYQIETINRQNFNLQKSKYNHLAWSISFGAMLGFAPPVLSQEKNIFNTEEQANVNQADNKKSITHTKIIEGVITDADFNAPLPNVTLSIENSTYSTTSNFDGKYSIAYDENVEKNQQVIVSFDEFETQKITLQALIESPNIVLKPLSPEIESVIFTGMVVVEKELNFFQRMWQKTKNIFKK